MNPFDPYQTEQLLQQFEDLPEDRKALAFSAISDYFKKLLAALKIGSPAPVPGGVFTFHTE